MVKAKNNLKTVRKFELKPCLAMSSDQLLVDCHLPKATYRQLKSFRIQGKTVGNVSVPGLNWVREVGREPITQRTQYVA